MRKKMNIKQVIIRHYETDELYYGTFDIANLCGSGQLLEEKETVPGAKAAENLLDLIDPYVYIWDYPKRYRHGTMEKVSIAEVYVLSESFKHMPF